MVNKGVRNLFLVLALIAVSSLVSFKIGQESVTVGGVTSEVGSRFNLDLMWKVKDKLSSTYLEKDKMDDKKMMYGAVSGMVSSLDDPYTVFLPPKDNQSANEDLKGEFGGVGIQLGYKDKTLAVMAPLPKTPADKAGVKAGDLILKITDKNKNIDRDTGGIALDEAVDLIRGEVGSEVTLKFFREGRPDTFDITLKRDNIVVASMELEWVEGKYSVPQGKKVAWIKMSKFSERIYEEWDEIVGNINKEKANLSGVVLDLRNNPGGYLDASVLVASDFLKEGVVVKQQNSDGSVKEYSVDKRQGRLTEPKLTVLINGGSASAAEILAGALKDHNRAKLVGEKSFGKGTVQQPENFADGSGIHITIAKWLLPSGKNIHKEGVMPDVEVKLTDATSSPTPTPTTGAETAVPEDTQLIKAVEEVLK